MREILFRAKRDPKYGTGWCYGVPYIDHENDYIMATCNSKSVIIPETIGQFTGLYDFTKWESLSKSEQQEWLKNHRADEWKGKRIFEGDIILVKFEEDNYYGCDVFVERAFFERFEVFFDIERCCWYARWLVDREETYCLYEFANECNECIVIGNLYDNPELIGCDKNA